MNLKIAKGEVKDMDHQEIESLSIEEITKKIESNKRLLLRFKSSRLLKYHYQNTLEELMFELKQRK